MSLLIQASVNGRLIGDVEIVNVTPCEHMSQSQCECEARYKVVNNGKRERKNVRHKRSESWHSLARKALEVCR